MLKEEIIPTNENLLEPDFDDTNEVEFICCIGCDGHPACEDFGCAYDLGLGKMVKKEFTSDDL